MAAGDLENIIPTPSATRTVNINLCDQNGAVHSVKEVHYVDGSAVDHLIWKRDHAPGPVGDEYSDVFSSGQIMFKWTANSSTISTVKIWCKNAGDTWEWVQGIYNSDGTLVSYTQVQPSQSTGILNVDGSEITVYTLECNLSCSVTTGNDYYIMLSQTYGSHWYPLVYKNETGDYWHFTGDEWTLNGNISGYYTAYNDHLIKAEVNGSQV